jgi:nicotinate-nucleotide adenylyltransferase
MVERATGGDPRFQASRVEIDRPGPSYTADTLRSLDGELTLILGGDQAAALPSWHAPEEVLRAAEVAVAERGDYERERIREALDGLEGAARVRFFDMPRIEISSSLVRRRAAAGHAIRYLVPDSVADYIASEGLYAGAPVGGGT